MPYDLPSETPEQLTTELERERIEAANMEHDADRVSHRAGKRLIAPSSPTCSARELIERHLAVLAILGYWLFSAFVGGMPAPSVASGVAYIWLHNSLQILAGSLTKAVASATASRRSPTFRQAAKTTPFGATSPLAFPFAGDLRRVFLHPSPF